MWLQELDRKMVPKSFALNFTDYSEHGRFLIASLRKNWMKYHTTIANLSKDVMLVNRKWTFCILGQWYCPIFRAIILIEKSTTSG